MQVRLASSLHPSSAELVSRPATPPVQYIHSQLLSSQVHTPVHGSLDQVLAPIASPVVLPVKVDLRKHRVVRGDVVATRGPLQQSSTRNHNIRQWR